MASAGVKEPLLETDRPYRGALNARPKKMPEKIVENKQSSTMDTATQVYRECKNGFSVAHSCTGWKLSVSVSKITAIHCAPLTMIG